MSFASDALSSMSADEYEAWLRDMEDEGAPAVHRCWNCAKPIPTSARRCPRCGVDQRR